MTKQQLTENTREMVKYILPEDCRGDNDIVENYTDTFLLIAEEYKEGFEITQLKKRLDKVEHDLSKIKTLFEYKKK